MKNVSTNSDLIIFFYYQANSFNYEDEGIFIGLYYIIFEQYLFLGPDTWPHNPAYPACAGEFQSPIDIFDEETVYDPNLKPFNFTTLNELIKWNCTHNGINGKTELH